MQDSSGAVIYGKAQTNGAIAIGTNIRLRRGGIASYDQMPSTKQVTKKQKPTITPTGNFKILFSLEEEGFINFYIGGDRATPTKIFSVEKTDVSTFYPRLTCHIHNTGSDLNNYEVSIKYRNADSKIRIINITDRETFDYITPFQVYVMNSDEDYLNFSYKGNLSWTSNQITPRTNNTNIRTNGYWGMVTSMQVPPLSNSCNFVESVPLDTAPYGIYPNILSGTGTQKFEVRSIGGVFPPGTLTFNPNYYYVNCTYQGMRYTSDTSGETNNFYIDRFVSGVNTGNYTETIHLARNFVQGRTETNNQIATSNTTFLPDGTGTISLSSTTTQVIEGGYTNQSSTIGLSRTTISRSENLLVYSTKDFYIQEAIESLTKYRRYNLPTDFSWGVSYINNPFFEFLSINKTYSLIENGTSLNLNSSFHLSGTIGSTSIPLESGQIYTFDLINIGYQANGNYSFLVGMAVEVGGKVSDTEYKAADGIIVYANTPPGYDSYLLEIRVQISNIRDVDFGLDQGDNWVVKSLNGSIDDLFYRHLPGNFLIDSEPIVADYSYDNEFNEFSEFNPLIIGNLDAITGLSTNQYDLQSFDNSGQFPLLRVDLAAKLNLSNFNNIGKKFYISQVKNSNKTEDVTLFAEEWEINSTGDFIKKEALKQGKAFSLDNSNAEIYGVSFWTA
ncbi:hypothetical protein JYQ62_22165 [Nostoc sp. UHCC 0702]|nr:hypothetical protein JYQ62_22165 [Nostoc sp. UHCC 0702]